MNCYNCGNPLAENQNTAEHIPPQNLYHGFDVSYKVNRITVPSCFTCNNNYSRIDEEFRNLVGTINNKPVYQKLIEKTFRAIQRNSKMTERLIFDVNKNIIANRFDANDINGFHIKNFKGVFHHNYGSFIPLDYIIKTDFRENKRESGLKLLKYLQNNFKWKHSGHPDIFRYIIQPFRQGYQFNGEDITPIENEKYYLCVLSYCLCHATIVLAQKPD